MSVRAKFFVQKVDPGQGAAASQVSLGAVCRGVENAMWSQATPAGFIQMHVKNDPAFEQFEQGAEYEVTFRKVAKPEPGDGHEIVEAVNMHGGIICEFCGAQLGFAEEAVEAHPHLKAYATPEARAEAEARHREAYGTPAVS